jgi:hypothetical protein
MKLHNPIIQWERMSFESMSEKISESSCVILIDHEPVHGSDDTACYEVTMRDYSDRCDSIIMNLVQVL